MSPQITFRGIPHSRRLEAAVLERVSWLEQFYEEIVSCRVMIEAPARHHHDGRHFHVTIELTVPRGKSIVISHEPSLHGLLKDAGAETHSKQNDIEAFHRFRHTAVHDAFDVARRRLQDLARRQRGAVKRHKISV